MSTKIPHVLLIARRYPPSVGGMEHFSYQLSEALQKKISVSLVAWGGTGRASAVLILPWLFLLSFWRLLWWRDVSLIHSQDAVTCPPAWLLAKIFHKPLLVLVNGLDVTYDNWFYQTTVIPFVRRADIVVAISRQTRDEALKRGILPDKLTIISPGVSKVNTEIDDKAQALASIGLSRFANKPILLTVGRLVKRKGVVWFIENVLPELYRDNPDVRYVVAGEGPEKLAIEAAIKIQKLEQVVQLFGRVNDVTKNTLYQVSDLFVMPNIAVAGDMEGFGMVAIEAAAARLPVVASRLEGIQDAVTDRQNGWLVDPGDAAAYHTAITALLESKRTRRSVGEQARRYTLEYFEWSIIADAFIAVYHTLQAKVHAARNFKFLLSVVILVLTLFVFILYVRHNPNVLNALLQVKVFDLVRLILLYVLVFISQLAVLYFSLVFYRKKISLGDNFLVSSYSSLTNFFGPTQAGSGVRALYLKAKLQVNVKDFIFVTLLYYACYAALSVVMLLADAGRIWQSLVALAVVILFSAGVIGGYKKSHKLKQQRVSLFAWLGILAATTMQVSVQSIIYFMEILPFDHQATFLQAVSYTGAANFSLFVSLTPGAIGIRESFLLFSQSLHHIGSAVIVSAGVLDRAVYVVFLGVLFVSVIAVHGRRKFQALRAPDK